LVQLRYLASDYWSPANKLRTKSSENIAFLGLFSAHFSLYRVKKQHPSADNTPLFYWLQNPLIRYSEMCCFFVTLSDEDTLATY
jgi:hypothetical protein